jgi:hypothetical protein
MSFLVNPYVYQTSLCPDADVNAFITATGITNATIIGAVCTLVTSMKANGTWAKMSAIYPMVGGTATTHKFNLKNPADTNAAFRLGFVGGWTHSSNGALPNGTNAYAETYFSPLLNGSQNSQHLSYYSRSNTNSSLAAAEIEMGSINSLGVGSVLEIRTANISYYKINSANPFISAADTDSRAFYIGNRTASNVVNGWRNSTKIANGTTASALLVNFNIALGAINANGLIQNYTRKQCAFATIGTGLTDGEAVALYNSIQAFQTTLARQV